MAKTIQRINRTGSTQNRPRHDRPKKLSAHAHYHIQRLCLGNRHVSAASIAAEVEGEGVSLLVLRPYATLHQISLHGCCSRRKPLLKMMHKEACKQFAEDKQTKDMDYWNHVLWSDETKINLFGSDSVKRVWRQPGKEYKDKCVLPTVKHGGGSVMSGAGHECCRPEMGTNTSKCIINVLCGKMYLNTNTKYCVLKVFKYKYSILSMFLSFIICCAVMVKVVVCYLLFT